MTEIISLSQILDEEIETCIEALLQEYSSPESGLVFINDSELTKFTLFLLLNSVLNLEREQLPSLDQDEISNLRGRIDTFIPTVKSRVIH